MLPSYVAENIKRNGLFHFLKNQDDLCNSDIIEMFKEYSYAVRVKDDDVDKFAIKAMLERLSD